jgi:hypothetical protein
MVAPRLPEIEAFVDELVARTDAIRNRKPWIITDADGREVEDNMLLVCLHGRLVSVDPRLVGITPTGPTLLEFVADKIAAEYRKGATYRYPATDGGDSPFHPRTGDFHLAFLDVGTPGSKGVMDADGNLILDKDKAYGLLREYLVLRGVRREHIAFGHDPSNLVERREQFAACRDGRIRVLITSTRKGGTGANIQTRLRCIYHIDAPWRPDEFEQRDGRQDRPGNEHDEVENYWFAMEGTFAPYMWQTLNRKRVFIDQLFSGDVAREVADVISEAALDFAHMKAISTGMEIVMRLEEAKAEVARLSNLATEHQAMQARVRRDIASTRREMRQTEHDVEVWRGIAEGTRSDRYLTSYLERLGEKDAKKLLAESARESRRRKTDMDPGSWRGVRVKFLSGWVGGQAVTRFQLTGKQAGWTQELVAPDSCLQPGQEWRLLAAIDNAIDSAADVAVRAAQRAKYLQSTLDDLQAQIGAPFPELSQLAEAIRRQEDLEAQIQTEIGDRTPAAVPEPVAA